jgi:hypothetical protein
VRRKWELVGGAHGDDCAPSPPSPKPRCHDHNHCDFQIHCSELNKTFGCETVFSEKLRNEGCVMLGYG